MKSNLKIDGQKSEVTNLRPPQPATRNLQPSTNYSLRKGLGVWELTFEGQKAILKHEQGIFYVAYLLKNPPADPIHGLALALRISALYHRPTAASEVVDPISGESIAPGADARLEERAFGLEDAEALAALRRKQLELEAILDDEDVSEPVKAEVLRELEAIYDFQKKNPSRTTDTAQKAVRTVRMAIKRFHRRLLAPAYSNGEPNDVLGLFAAHLEKCLLIPSARYSQPGCVRTRATLVGCFTYEPPPGVIWA